MSGAARLAVAGLRVTLGGRAVLSGIDFALGAGEALAVIGASGCGKTTLLRALAGLCPLAGGSVRIDGADLATARGAGPRARALALVFQDPVASLDPRLSVNDSLLEAWRAMGAMGAMGRDRAQAFAAALAAVRLSPAHAARRPRELSIGQCQRAQLARALLCEPRVLLLDEVTSALDASVREDLARALEAARDGGAALVLVTHDLPLARRLCTRVVVLDGGQVLESGNVADVWAHPRELQTQRLLAACLPADPAVARERLRWLRPATGGEAQSTSSMSRP